MINLLRNDSDARTKYGFVKWVSERRDYTMINRVENFLKHTNRQRNKHSDIW